jgi:hypothetical protein
MPDIAAELWSIQDIAFLSQMNITNIRDARSVWPTENGIDVVFDLDGQRMVAARYDNRHLIAETWLVISANLNKWGAGGSTTIVPAMLRVDQLDTLYQRDLTASNFDRAYLVLHMGNILYGWDRPNGWRLIANPDARDRQLHQNHVLDLIFNQIPRYHRG